MIAEERAKQWFDVAKMMGAIENTGNGRIRITRGGLMTCAAVISSLMIGLEPDDPRFWAFSITMRTLQQTAIRYDHLEAES